ncbi:10821_t:CDS:2 [Ambispora leptoticha]|uniref:10821_t:CDS:1 n=1 Tax=Ambispora leptoticha TaxID=144679 RepID=A0A9N9FRT0_9GLOM|nr:10821_t:CDS:2 [Ambispora leptoticha]
MESIKSIIPVLLAIIVKKNFRILQCVNIWQVVVEHGEIDWERSEDDFDRIRNMNSSNRRQRRIGGNNIPAPSTRKLNIRSASPSHNPNVGNAGIPETLSPQPPPYGATDEVQNNNSSHEVAVSGNMPSSHDVVGNQPLSHMELINEEDR